MIYSFPSGSFDEYLTFSMIFELYDLSSVISSLIFELYDFSSVTFSLIFEFKFLLKIFFLSLSKNLKKKKLK